MACGAWIARVKVSQGEVRHLAALPLVATNPYQNPNLCTRSDRERKTTKSARGDGVACGECCQTGPPAPDSAWRWVMCLALSNETIHRTHQPGGLCGAQPQTRAR